MKNKYLNMLKFIFLFYLIELSFQKFLRKTKEEEDPLSICLPIESTDSNNDGETIICSNNICYGKTNNTRDDTFTNITLECNTVGCRKKKPEKGEQCNIDEDCPGCIIINLTCYNGICIGGPSDNERNNNENNNRENNSISDSSLNIKNDSESQGGNNNEEEPKGTDENGNNNDNESNNNESNNNESNNDESNNDESNNGESNSNESNY